MILSYFLFRVLNVFRHWVENHYYDFQQESTVLDQLKEFVGTVKAKNMQKLVASIHRALHKVQYMYMYYDVCDVYGISYRKKERVSKLVVILYSLNHLLLLNGL